MPAFHVWIPSTKAKGAFPATFEGQHQYIGPFSGESAEELIRQLNAAGAVPLAPVLEPVPEPGEA